MASRLSPEAQARLAAARAIAEGKAPPASAQVAPAPAATVAAGGRAPVGAKPDGPRAAAESADARKGSSIALAIGAVGLLAAIAGGVWLSVGHRPDLLGATASIQKDLLEGDVRGAEGKKAVAEVIRNADQMSKQELEVARKALEEDWSKTRDEAIDEFFAAPEGDRTRLADEGVDRTITYRKLRFGLSPQAREEKGRKQNPPDDGDRRKLFDRYAQALQVQAKKRGIALPEWQ